MHRAHPRFPEHTLKQAESRAAIALGRVKFKVDLRNDFCGAKEIGITHFFRVEARPGGIISLYRSMVHTQTPLHLSREGGEMHKKVLKWPFSIFFCRHQFNATAKSPFLLLLLSLSGSFRRVEKRECGRRNTS